MPAYAHISRLPFFIMSLLILSLSACGGGGDSEPVTNPQIPDSDPVISDSDSVTRDRTSLELSFSGTDTSDTVTSNLTLPSTGSNGSTITWSATYTTSGDDASAIITSNGIVTRPTYGNGNANLTFTATITKGNETATKIFYLTVLEAPQLDSQAVASDKAALAIIFGGSDAASAVTVDLTLSTSGASGTMISWATDTPSSISTDGAVARSSAGNVSVQLTATISKNLESDSKVFNITVTQRASYKTFITSSGYQTGDLGGVSGADAKCMSDANYTGSGTYKALLVDGINRRASSTANNGDSQIDWVLDINADFTLSDGSTKIFTTNSNAIFVFGTLDSPFAGVDPGAPVWTGLSSDWTTNSDTCNSWSSNAGHSGIYGGTDSTDGNAISISTAACDGPGWAVLPKLICVEQ